MRRINSKTIKTYFPITMKDILITIAILGLTFFACSLLKLVYDSNTHISIVFILAIFLIARFTNGYLYGILSSFLSVMLVNYFFTYPYYNFNFTLEGYPITIACMLSVAIITSMMTTRIKEQNDIKIEAEREKTRSNLLRAVSHDLRTPLTSILGSTSAIIENDDYLSKEERITLLSEIKDDCQWLIRMVENLLSITRIDEENRTKLIKTPELIEEVVSEAIQKFKKRFPNQLVKVKVPDEPLMISMDAILIEQVIINLLENSVLHAKNLKKIELDVELDTNFVYFNISDDGDGIDPKVLPHIFKEYCKTSYSPDTGKRNMGIGLSVCYTIIKSHGGNMYANNKKEGGAIFTFTLPLQED